MNSGHIPVGLYCPECRDAGAGEVPMVNSPGNGIICHSGHKFDDTQALLARKPKPAPMPKIPTPPPDNCSEMRILVSNPVRKSLETRGNFNAMLNDLLYAVANGCFIVAGVDMERLSQLCGTRIADPQNLIGNVYAIAEQRRELQETVNRLDAQVKAMREGGGGANGDGIVLILDETTRNAITMKAQGRLQTPEAILQEIITTAIQNDWV